MATVCKYAVPDGYPDKPVKNKQVDISGVDDLKKLFHASIELKNKEKNIVISNVKFIVKKTYCKNNKFYIELFNKKVQ